MLAISKDSLARQFSETPPRRVVTLLVMAFVAFNSPCHAEQFAFDFPPPPDQARLRSVGLWATQYLVHAADARPAGNDTVEMRKRDGSSTGLYLRRKDWCNAVMEGTVAVMTGGAVKTFNVDGLQDEPQTDCSTQFRSTDSVVLRRLSRQVFAQVSGARVFGLGINGFRLVPFRTVAADPSELPPGTVLYIAGLKGKFLQLPDGSTAQHDGYVFVGDRGGSIKGNHIDFFTGISKTNPAPMVITSDSKRPFKALIVRDDAAVSALRELHLKQ